MYMALLSSRTSPQLHFTSLHFKTKSLHINHVNSHYIITLYITSLIYTQFPLELLVTTFLTLFRNVYIYVYIIRHKIILNFHFLWVSDLTLYVVTYTIYQLPYFSIDNARVIYKKCLNS